MTEEEIKAMQESLDKANARIKTLCDESAKYRAERSLALKKLHAQGAVLKAHNISHDIDESKLSTLEVNGGEVTGDYTYTPPRLEQKAVNDSPPTADTGNSNVLTAERIKNMSHAEINARWDEVSSVLKQGKQG